MRGGVSDIINQGVASYCGYKDATRRIIRLCHDCDIQLNSASNLVHHPPGQAVVGDRAVGDRQREEIVL